MPLTVHSSKRSVGLSVLLAACGWATPALGQDSLTGVENSSEFEMMGGPGNLPGRERGDRREPEPAPAAEPREWFGGKPWLEWSRATGDWGGARTKLEEFGLTINGSWSLDWSSVWSGGLTNKASTRQLLDINATLDLQKVVGLEGGTVYANFYSTDGRGGSEHAGDYTGVSNNFTGVNVHQLAELWYQQWFFDKKARIKVGKVDANAEFAFFSSTGDFLNGGSVNPTTLYPVFPTYPNPATAVNLFVYPTEQWHIGAGFYDGSIAIGKPTGRLGPATFFDGDAYFWIIESGFTWSSLGALGNGRALAGGWWSTPEFTAFDGSTQDGQGGFYVMLEQQLLKREGVDKELDAKKGLFAFGEYGWADEDVNAVSNHVGLGLVSHGTFAGRDSDSAGVMWNWIDFSSAPGSSFEGDEHSFEVYYKVQLTPWASLTPDLQYIINPSGNPAVDDALVGAVRLIIVF